jgi:prepilin-type N-terminal cleavage/methylation domain-containing protein
MAADRRSGFTLVEILIVVAIIALLAATIAPQVFDLSKHANSSTAEFNLRTLRSQIEVYKSQHDGRLPTGTLAELTNKTDFDGAIGTTALFPFGPYLREVPANPFTNNNSVTLISNSPAQSSNVTGNGGWLYNATTGEIWLDHVDYVQK